MLWQASRGELRHSSQSVVVSAVYKTRRTDVLRLLSFLLLASAIASFSIRDALATHQDRPTAPAQLPSTPPSTPPPVAAPTALSLSIIGAAYQNGRLTVQIECIQDGVITFAMSGSGAIGSASFRCTQNRSSGWLTLGSRLTALARGTSGLHLIVTLRSGTSYLSAPITLRPTQTGSSSRSTQAATGAEGTFDTYWDGATSNAVRRPGTGGDITVGTCGVVITRRSYLGREGVVACMALLRERADRTNGLARRSGRMAQSVYAIPERRYDFWPGDRK